MNIVEALPDFDHRLLMVPEGRRALTRNSPLLFAYIYLRHKLKFPGNDSITLNQFHLDIAEYAQCWIGPLGAPRAHRDCFIAPRSCGKSTWIFHILPLWAAAHEHKKYMIAFSDSEDQATNWLRNFREEVATNDLLKSDFPALCEPFKLGEAGKALMNNRNALKQANGFIFQAKGVDSAVLGANVDGTRPQVILFDDVEPPEANYGPTDLAKRKQTILQTHFYLNTNAIVAFVGTTTMPNSIIDQFRKVGDARSYFDGEPDTFSSSLDQELRWIVDENINTHYYPAISTDDEGQEHSIWPEVWPLEQWDAVRSTRAFAMNMMNRPISAEDGYWVEEDINVDRTEFGNTILSVDPAVTTAKRSDYTGLAVLSRGQDGKVYLRHAEQVKLPSDALREHCEELITRYGVGLTLVETNQGGDLWKQVFKGLPRVRMLRQSIKKEVRIAQTADFYKKGRVLHAVHFPVLEEQMLAYPNVGHDDLIDAVATGVLYFEKNKGGKVAVQQIRYQEV